MSADPYNALELSAGQFREIPVLADAIIDQGTLVAINSSGYARKAGDVAGLRVLGRCEAAVDATDLSSGDIKVTVKRGVFLYDNDTEGTPLTRADVGLVAYVLDERTVSADPGTNDVIAGEVFNVTDEGVWVDTALSGNPALS